MTIRVTKRFFIVITIVVTAVVVALGFALTSTSSASFCSSCHNMKATVQALEQSPHAGINCEECHTQPGPFFFLTAKLEALEEPIQQLTGDYEKPILGSVVNASCERCHTDKQLFRTVDVNVVTVNHIHLTIRVNHQQFIQAGYQCVQCHSAVAHGNAVPVGARTSPTMDQCLVCHNNHYKAANGAVAVGRCSLCHANKPPAEPASHDNAALWLKIHGTNGILSTCTACHTSATACSSCHNGVVMPHPASWLEQHGLVEKKLGEKACSLCHDTKTYCVACHQVPMPHPSNFLALHPAAAAKSDETCFNCHSVANCQACHEEHASGNPPAHGFFSQTLSPSPSPSQSGL